MNALMYIYVVIIVTNNSHLVFFEYVMLVYPNLQSCYREESSICIFMNQSNKFINRFVRLLNLFEQKCMNNIALTCCNSDLNEQ